jgi:hypothetical protein
MLEIRRFLFSFIKHLSLPKIVILWDKPLRRPVAVNGRFKLTDLPHLQDRRVSQTRNQHEAAASAALVPCLAYT